MDYREKDRLGTDGRSGTSAMENAGQRNGRARGYNVYSAEYALQLVADKWTVAIFHALRDGATRYGEIRRAVPGISKKMLTQTLRKLERDGLVQRIEFDVTPPHVEYTFTPLAESLLPRLTELCRWAQQFADEVRAAQVQYDAGRE